MKRAAAKGVEARIQALPEDLRDRVIERAAILWDSGVEEARANEMAFEMETGETLATPGLARAKKRSAAAERSTAAEESAATPKKAARSGTDD